MPASCFSSTSSSAPASQSRMSTENRSCFGALFKACRHSRSISWGDGRTDEFEKNPHFKKTTEDEFHKLYKVKKTIGVGGFSVVKKGKHIPTGQDVAIKVIDRSKFDPNDGSLEAEIVVLDRVRHEYCISFKECFFTRKHVYVITELVTGGELLDRVLKDGKYGEREAARTMKQLLEGVAYLHSIGVTHRDLKLENILLQSPDDDSPIKIADFGLSKIFTGAAPLTTICGSPQYVAPEVLEVGQKRLCYTPAADLWSTGVIMYILLSGYSPFDDPNEAILFQKIKKGMYSMKQPVWDSITYEGKDLMKRLLITIPEKRLTAKQALQHPWFQIMIDQLEENLPAKKSISRASKMTTQVSKKTETQIEPIENLLAILAKQETEGYDLEQSKTSNSESKENLPSKQGTEGDNQEQPKTCNNESKEDLPTKQGTEGDNQDQLKPCTNESKEDLPAQQGTEGDNQEQLKTCNNKSKENLPAKQGKEGDNQERLKTGTNESEENVPVQAEVSDKPNENVQAQQEISVKSESDVQERLKVTLPEAQEPSIEAKKTS